RARVPAGLVRALARHHRPAPRAGGGPDAVRRPPHGPRRSRTPTAAASPAPDDGRPLRAVEPLPAGPDLGGDEQRGAHRPPPHRRHRLVAHHTLNPSRAHPPRHPPEERGRPRRAPAGGPFDAGSAARDGRSTGRSSVRMTPRTTADGRAANVNYGVSSGDG